ncbi:hypothetical protein HYALB_00004083 [Hymenoscyphus albidus]|uniref:Uncharacterized protein n=1 Tax=Hymenoscyphus albidus TaxID=595503 RepID=A0A9N9M1J3_9HELO|nr:hypothetical protein HYALB_00004083 [Hymenoscyphus albidus]
MSLHCRFLRVDLGRGLGGGNVDGVAAGGGVNVGVRLTASSATDAISNQQSGFSARDGELGVDAGVLTKTRRLEGEGEWGSASVSERVDNGPLARYGSAGGLDIPRRGRGWADGIPPSWTRRILVPVPRRDIRGRLGAVWGWAF